MQLRKRLNLMNIFVLLNAINIVLLIAITTTWDLVVTSPTQLQEKILRIVFS